MDEKKVLIEREDIDVIRMSLETICQMAGDRKTGNGFEMQPMETLDEIRVKAKDALEYMDMFMGTKFNVDRVDLSAIKPETGVPLRNN